MGELLTVNEAALKFGFSTKYIYALIQAGELKSLKKHGRTYIDPNDLADAGNVQMPQDNTPRQEPQQPQPSTPPPSSDSALLDYLYEVVAEQKQQIAQLQKKVDHCQQESLNAIKEAYTKKDEQLQQYMVFLNNSTRELIASTLDMSASQQPSDVIYKEASVDADINQEPVKVLLNDYLIDQGYNKKERKKIYARCQNAFLEDSTRFHVQNKKLYIYPYEYLYDDLL